MMLLTPQTAGIPLPRPSLVTQPFWDACAEGRLIFQRCNCCEASVFEPSVICRACGGRNLRWEESSGLGTVYSWTIAFRPQTEAFTVPYAPIIVDVDEGFQILSNLVECAPDDIDVGMRVQVSFHEVGGFALPYFRPK